MSARECQWFLGCRGPAVALVQHPRGPVPTCQRCIDRMGLRPQIIAPIVDEPDVAVPAARLGSGRIAEHFFQAVCICPCGDCTEHVGDRLIMCTCPDCPTSVCGAKAPTRAGVA